uniref:C-type lectin domain-containing protein n=1 Tax=Monopterus albus TaxID=43700 RepID=A0A3Q3IK73_MONAL
LHFTVLELFFFIISHYFLVQRPMPWLRAQEFCQRHYVDLAILSTEAQYLTLLSATAANNISFWLGLRYQSTLNVWAWVNGDELSYEHWYKRNPGGHCASLEAMLEKDQKLLARYCDELHMSVCQGEQLVCHGLTVEAQYLTLLSATAANNISFWLGLRYQSTLNVWAWVNGDELSYEHWYKRNPGGHCASLETLWAMGTCYKHLSLLTFHQKNNHKIYQ